MDGRDLLAMDPRRSAVVLMVWRMQKRICFHINQLLDVAPSIDVRSLC